MFRCLRFPAPCIPLLIVLAGLVLIVACEQTEEANSGDTVYEGAQCSISGDNMTIVPFDVLENTCGALGLSFVFDKLEANPFLTVYGLQGQFSIPNDNTYLLRGPGTTTAKACYEPIQGAGTFKVMTKTLSCNTAFTIDVVTSTDKRAEPFCSIFVAADLSCSEGQGDTNNNPEDCDYKDEFDWVYDDCDYILADENGNSWTQEEAKAYCDECLGACALAYADQDDCGGFADCATTLCY